MGIPKLFLFVAATFILTPVPVKGNYRIRSQKLATFHTGLYPARTPEVTERVALLCSEVRVRAQTMPLQIPIHTYTQQTFTTT